MSDITRDDLRKLAGMLPVTDEEFDRLAFERAAEVGWAPDNETAVVARTWMRKNPGQALRALLTDECDNCAGYGNLHGGDCPKCGGRGWLPKDGVKLGLPWVTLHMLAIPLDWCRRLDACLPQVSEAVRRMAQKGDQQMTGPIACPGWGLRPADPERHQDCGPWECRAGWRAEDEC